MAKIFIFMTRLMLLTSLSLPTKAMNLSRLTSKASSLSLSALSGSGHGLDINMSVAVFSDEENRKYSKSNSPIYFSFTFYDARTLVLKINSIINKSNEHIPFDNLHIRAPIEDTSGHYLRPFIMRLKLSGPWVTDSTITSFALELSKLESLDLEGCSKITGSGLSSLAPYLNRLTSLNLRRCKSINDAGLIEILLSFQGLDKVDLRGCRLISSPYRKVLSIQEINKLRERLKSLFSSSSSKKAATRTAISDGAPDSQTGSSGCPSNSSYTSDRPTSHQSSTNGHLVHSENASEVGCNLFRVCSLQ